MCAENRDGGRGGGEEGGEVDGVGIAFVSDMGEELGEGVDVAFGLAPEMRSVS